jgi:hypothetical protein
MEELTNSSRTPSKPKRTSHPSKTRFTVTLPVPLLDRLSNAVYWTADLTMARLIEEAVADSVEEDRRITQAFAEFPQGPPHGIERVQARTLPQ